MSTDTKLLTAPKTGARRRPRPSDKKRWTPGEIVVMVVLAALVVVVASPVVYALLNSFRSYS